MSCMCGAIDCGTCFPGSREVCKCSRCEAKIQRWEFDARLVQWPDRALCFECEKIVQQDAIYSLTGVWPKCKRYAYWKNSNLVVHLYSVDPVESLRFVNMAIPILRAKGCSIEVEEHFDPDYDPEMFMPRYPPLHVLETLDRRDGGDRLFRRAEWLVEMVRQINAAQPEILSVDTREKIANCRTTFELQCALNCYPLSVKELTAMEEEESEIEA